jgi:hypothetical protein
MHKLYPQEVDLQGGAAAEAHFTPPSETQWQCRHSHPTQKKRKPDAHSKQFRDPARNLPFGSDTALRSEGDFHISVVVGVAGLAVFEHAVGHVQELVVKVVFRVAGDPLARFPFRVLRSAFHPNDTCPVFRVR